jgi:signal transduction histidine kinase/DNA-binding response OmpR family regulator/HPt (histidine-containing phosphotransfer) domain-containing protein
MWKALNAGQVWRGEFCNIKKNGEIFWENAVISPIKNQSGTVTHFVAVKEDITERKKAQDALLEAKAAAESANLAKSEFLARMSHEIRTPMNAIIGMSSLAQMTDLTLQQSEYISNISNASHALLKIINDILDFSKIEAGKYALESVEFRLDDVLKNIKNIIGISAGDKALEMVFSISGEVPETLVGDPLRLEQVLINLGSNAVKFTHEGEVVLDVELLSMDEENATLEFSVIDSGIGMTEEQKNGLFRPFAQADGSTTRKYGGTGLGLSISKRLIEMMGGEVKVSSALNEGSRFSFTAVFAYKGSKASRPDDLKGFRAMVLEDNWLAGECLCGTLSDMGINAITVSSIGEAKKEYKRAAKQGKPYEIIFVDSSTAEIKDFEIFRSFRDSTRRLGTKVILMSKQGDKSGLDCADRNICDACISKPVLNSEFISAIRDVLGMPGKSEDNIIEPVTGNHAQFENLRGHRVLLAEDNMVNKLLAVKLLEGAGIAVDTVNNGKDAVHAVETGDYDLVLMDIEMPLMDGLVATSRIRSNPRHKDLPIIAMTAHAMDEHRQRSLEAGMNGHISKPINVGVLFNTIQKWIAPGRISSQDTRHARPDGARGPQRGLPGNVPELDMRHGIENCDGDQEFYLELLLEFRERYGKAVGDIETHIREGKTKKALIDTHSLKGAAGTLGALELERASEELEAALAEGAGDVPERLLGGLRDAFSIVMEGLGNISAEIARPKDEVAAMYEALKDLGNSLKTSRPRRCLSDMERIKGLDWPEDIKPALNELETLVSQYKYHSARKVLDALMNRFGVKLNEESL